MWGTNCPPLEMKNVPRDNLSPDYKYFALSREAGNGLKKREAGDGL